MFKKILQLLKLGGDQIFSFPIFEKIRGYKTLILSVITILIGITVYLQESLHGGLGNAFCNVGFTTFCDLAGSKFYGALLVLIGFLNKILRLITDIPVPGFEPKSSSNGQIKK